MEQTVIHRMNGGVSWQMVTGGWPRAIRERNRRRSKAKPAHLADPSSGDSPLPFPILLAKVISR